MSREIALAEQTITDFSYWEYFGCYINTGSVPYIELEAGMEYTVVWDSTSYQCIATEESLPDFGLSKVVCVGNMGLLPDGESTGEPFVYYSSVDGSGIFTSDEGESHTVFVYRQVPDVVLKDLNGDAVIYESVSAVMLNMSDGSTQIFYKEGSADGAVNYENPVIVTVGDDSYYSLTSIKSVTLPKATSLGHQAFYNCINLEKADFPLVTSIGTWCFCGCNKLDTLILRSSTVVELTDTYSGILVFLLLGTPIDNGAGYIYVPSSLVEAYKTADGWSNWANQFRAIEDYPDICG